MSKNIKSLADLVNGEALRLQTFWVSFLTLAAVAFLMVSSISHQDLFWGKELKVPILGFELDLVGFFIVTPGLYLCFHVYVLLKIALLKSAHRSFERLLVSSVISEGDRREARELLVMSLLLQALVPSKSIPPVIHVLIKILSFATIVLVPVGLLMFTAVAFLPYQSDAVTLFHLALITTDMIAVGLVALVTLGDGSDVKFRPAISVAVIVSLISALTWSLLTFPGSSRDNNSLARLVIGQNTERGITTTSLHGLFPTTLALSRREFVAESDNFGRVFQDRSFRLADFSGGVLSRLSFAGVDLRGANFVEATLREVDLSCIPDIPGTRDPGSDVWRTQGSAPLSSEDLYKAISDRLDLGCTALADAQLNNIVLENVSLDGLALIGIDFDRADITSASFRGTYLHDVGFDHATVRDSYFDGTTLNFTNANSGRVAFFEGGEMLSTEIFVSGDGSPSLTLGQDRISVDLTAIGGRFSFEGEGGELSLRVQASDLEGLQISNFLSGVVQIVNSRVSQFRATGPLPRMDLRCSEFVNDINFGSRGLSREVDILPILELSLFGIRFDKFELQSYRVHDLSLNFSEGETVRLVNLHPDPTPRSHGTDQIEIMASSIEELRLIRNEIDVLELQRSAFDDAYLRDVNVGTAYLWGTEISGRGSLSGSQTLDQINTDFTSYWNDDDFDEEGTLYERLGETYDYHIPSCSDPWDDLANMRFLDSGSLEPSSDWDIGLADNFSALIETAK